MLDKTIMHIARQQFFPDYNEIMQMKMTNFYGDEQEPQVIKSEARVRNPHRDMRIKERISFKQNVRVKSNSARHSVFSMARSISLLSHENRSSDNSPNSREESKDKPGMDRQLHRSH